MKPFPGAKFRVLPMMQDGSASVPLEQLNQQGGFESHGLQGEGVSHQQDWSGVGTGRGERGTGPRKRPRSSRALQQQLAGFQQQFTLAAKVQVRLTDLAESKTELDLCLSPMLLVTPGLVSHANRLQSSIYYYLLL